MEEVMDEIEIKKYSDYKDSGVDLIGEIPKHWNFGRLKSLVELLTGFPFKSDKYSNSGIKLARGINVKEGVLNWDETCYWPVVEKHLKNYLLSEDDILIAMDGSKVGKNCCMIQKHDLPILLLQRVARLRTKDEIIPRFLFYNIFNKKFLQWVEMSKTDPMVPHIAPSDINNFIIAIPPLIEQTAIIQFLDYKTALIDKAIGIKEKQIELLKERRQILIHRAVTRGLNPGVKMKDSGVEWIGEIPEGWEVKRLKDICYINLNSLGEDTNKSLSFNYVDIGSVTLEDGIIQTEKYVFKDAPSRARRIARVGDTIISTVRTYLKAIDFIDSDKSRYIYSTGFAVLQPKNFIYPEFLAHFVRSDAFTQQVTVNSKGMSYPAINSTDIGRLWVIECSLDEQKKIVEHIQKGLAKIAVFISLKQQEIDKLKEYKSSLINSAVTGKIKVC